MTERKKWDLKQVHDECMLDLWRHGGRNMLTGEKLERLPPHLWEQFRVELQNLYRRATGEEFAVLTVENNP